MKRLTIVLTGAALATALCMCGCGTQPEAVEKAPQKDQKTTEQPRENVVVDKSGLQEEIDSQGQYQESDYPEDAWANYKSALENAHAANSDSNASQDEVDSAESSLRNSEYALMNATSKDHPKKFDYDWYKSGQLNSRDGAWVAAACMVSIAFQHDGERYLVATIANDDATLSDHDVLLQEKSGISFESYEEGSVLTILGTTEEMKQVSIGKNYSEWLPTINVVEVMEAP